MTDKKADFKLQNERSVYLLRPCSDAAIEWVNEYLPEDRLDFCGAVVVEHRYISDIVDGFLADGLSVNILN